MGKSKFEERLLTKMDAEKNKEAVAERAYKKSSNVVKQQISALKIKQVDLQILQEERQEALEEATFCEKFSITKYDAAYDAVQEIEEELGDVERTLSRREKLLESWA